MKFFMDFFESILIDVGVDLGSGDVGMAKHELDGSQVSTMGQEVGGKGVTQHVRGDGFPDAGRSCRLLDDLPETESGHGAAPVADKKGVTAPSFEDQRSCCPDVLLDDVPGRYAKGDEPLLVALADHPDKTGRKVAGGKRDRDQLCDPQSCGVEQMQHGVVSLDLRGDGHGRGQKSGDIAQGKGLGQLAAGPWQLNCGQGVVAEDVVGL